MSEIKEIKVYSSYTDSQKRATQKYRENNKDKVNEQRKKYYLSRKEKDPNFLEYKRSKAKEYYLKKKLLKVIHDVVPVIEEISIPKPEIIEKVEEITQIDVKKPKAIKKVKKPLEPIIIEEPIIEVIIEPVKVEEPFQIYQKKRKLTKKAV